MVFYFSDCLLFIEYKIYKSKQLALQLSFSKFSCFLWMMKCLELKRFKSSVLDLIFLGETSCRTLSCISDKVPVPLVVYTSWIWTCNGWPTNKMQVQQSFGKTDNHLMYSERPVGGWVWTPGLKYIENTKSQSMPL